MVLVVVNKGLLRRLGRLRRGNSSLVLLLDRARYVLLEEGDEGFERPVAVVVNELLRTGLLELERGEAGNAEGNAWWEVVLGRIHLSTVNKVSMIWRASKCHSAYMTRRSLASA